MIPKILHYCWFGKGGKSEAMLSCMESWKKYLPDFELKEWNETNFDVDSIKFTSQAYKRGKYAFVSDYARVCALERLGGIYFDTDMEALRSFDDLLGLNGFLGFEQDNILSMAVMASIPHASWLKELKSYYESKPFVRWYGRLNKTPNSIVTARILQKHGVNLDDSTTFQQYGDELRIFPRDYFSPKDYKTGKSSLTENTYSIHHFEGSWK